MVDVLEVWWLNIGRYEYPQKELLLLCDAGPPNSYRSYKWKWMLQLLVDKYQLTIHVCHYPPGTSNWNPIEHRLFSPISKNCQGIPLKTYEIALELISNARTSTGLTVEAVLCENEYKKLGEISKFDLSTINSTEKEVCGEWNYKIEPRNMMDVQRRKIIRHFKNKIFPRRSDAKNESLEFFKKYSTQHLSIRIGTILSNNRRKNGKKGRPPKNCKMFKVYSVKLECTIIE